MPSVQCPICLDSDRVFLESKRLNLHVCKSCKHTFTSFSDILRQSEGDLSHSDQSHGVKSQNLTDHSIYDKDYFIKEHKNWFLNPNYKLFDSIYCQFVRLLKTRQFKLLDVGCGRGDFLKHIAKGNHPTELFGIDLVSNSDPRIHFLKGDFLNTQLETEFDAICSIAVIEHIENLQLFVKKLNSVLRPGGILIVVTINNNSLMYKLARLLERIGMHTSYDRLYSPHHLQHYTNYSLGKLLKAAGFNVLSHRNHNYPMKAVDVPKSNFFKEYVYKLLVGIIFLLSVPFRCGIHQTIVCQKENSTAD